MKAGCLANPVYSPPKTARRNFNMLNMALKQRLSYGRKRQKFTGKERDAETGLYYYGARYLDPKTGRWLSGDPALGEYFPSAPVNDEAKKRNGNLPGQGGVFNYVNLHAYHYAGNNPVRYVDPDGEDLYNFTEKDIIVKLERETKEKKEFVIVHPNEMYKGSIDGAVLEDGTVIKVSAWKGNSIVINVVVETIDGKDTASLLDFDSFDLNYRNDLLKGGANFFARLFSGEEKLLSGVYAPEAVEKYSDLKGWVVNSKNQKLIDHERRGVKKISEAEKKDIMSDHKKYRMFDQE